MYNKTTGDSMSLHQRIVAISMAAAMVTVPVCALAAGEYDPAPGSPISGVMQAAAETTTSDQTTANKTGADVAADSGKGLGKSGRGEGDVECKDLFAGLTDAEKTELTSLMKKKGELTDEERVRASELRDKARYAATKEAIEADADLTDTERKQLLSKLDELKDTEAKIDAYLSDSSFQQLCEKRDEAEEALEDYLDDGRHHHGPHGGQDGAREQAKETGTGDTSDTADKASAAGK